MTSTMPLLSLDSVAMLCRVDPRGHLGWASSVVDGWAPCFFGQEVQSLALGQESRHSVSSPFTPLWQLCRVVHEERYKSILRGKSNLTSRGADADNPSGVGASFIKASLKRCGPSTLSRRPRTGV